jgi:hypothetical protein
MVGSPFSRRKLTAYDRTCLSRGKILIKSAETGRIYCRESSRYTKKMRKEAEDLLKSSTVERLKSFLELKGFHGYSKLRKHELIKMILKYTDWITGEIIYRRKLVERDEVKSSRKRSKSARSAARHG